MRAVLDHMLLIGAVFIFCGPVIWLLVTALYPGVLRANWMTLTAQLSAEAYGPALDRMVFVTFALASVVSLLTTTFSFLAAFVFAYFRKPFLALLFWLSITTLYFPVEARMLHTFDVIVALGMTSSFTGLALPVLQLGLGTLFFRQYLKRVPAELFEAAKLDAAGPLRCLLQIVLPLSLGAIGVVALVTFILGWNQYLWPLMASVDDSHWTLVRGLERVRAGSGAGLLLATMSLVPPLIILLVLSRLFQRTF